MPTANQTFRRPPLAQVTRDDLLNPNVSGNITLDGVKKNIQVCLVYMEAWIRGIGCSPINFLMVRNRPTSRCNLTDYLIICAQSIGRCGYRRGITKSALAVGASRGQHRGRNPTGQAVRAWPSRRTAREPHIICSSRQQVRAHRRIPQEGDHRRGLLRLFARVSVFRNTPINAGIELTQLRSDYSTMRLRPRSRHNLACRNIERIRESIKIMKHDPSRQHS